MNNAWSDVAASLRQLFEMKGKRIRQSTGAHSCSGMDHEARRFVYHHHHVVLVDYVERNIFRSERCGWSLCEIDFDLVAGAKLVGGFGRLAVYENIFVVDQALQSRATPAVDRVCEVQIETLSRVIVARIEDSRFS